MYVFCPRYIDSRAVHTGRSTSQVTQQNNADTNLAVSLAARSVGRRLFFCTAFDVCTLSCAALVIPCRSALREGRCLVAFAWISKFATASIFFFVMGLALRSCPPRKATMRRLRGSSLARARSFGGGKLPQHEASGSLGTPQR